MHPGFQSSGKPADLDEVLADYMRQVDGGEPVDREALIAAHPALAADLHDYFSQAVAVERFAAGATADFAHQATPRSGLEVRCPSCHTPMDVAGDTALTDLTCTACGSHFSLVDQSKATHMAPLLTKMGRFELIERLGVGGFGTVWKARDKELDRTVAIKIPRASTMTGEEQEKFFREARAAAQLKHPSIVSVHEVGRDGDSVYIVSDFVRGVTLGDWLTGQQLTSREAAELCAKIADALHHAHEQGVVHRDLKPANIMIDGDGEPHLMDFGLARREVGEVTVTMDGQVLGTPAYMSPEQAQGEAHKADRRSDVYSLGVILFQLLTGELPFRGNARMLVHQVINDDPPSPRKFNANVPKDLETISLKCLEKDPDKRYRSAASVADELRRFLNGEPIVARPLKPPAKAWRWIKRKPAVASLLGLLLGSLIVGTSISAFFAIEAKREQQLALLSAERADLERERAERERESAERDRKSADDSRRDTEVQLQRNRLLQARLQIETGDFASARLALLQPIDSTVEEEWRWTTWQYFRQNPEVERLDLAMALGLDHKFAPNRSGSRGRIVRYAGRLVAHLVPRDEPPRMIDLTTRQAVSLEPMPELPAADTQLTLSEGLVLRSLPSPARNWQDLGKLQLEKSDGTVIWQQPEPVGRITSMAVHPNLETVALGLGNGEVRLYELAEQGESADLNLTNTLRGSEEDIVSLAFDSTGEELFGLSGDWILRSWAWRPMPDVEVSPTGNDTVRRLRFSRSGKLLASGSYDGTIIVFDAITRKPKLEWKAHPQTAARFGGLEFTGDERLLLSSGTDAAVIKLWDLTSAKLIDTLATAQDTARFILAGDGKTLFVSAGTTIDKWDLPARKRLSRVNPDAPDASMDFYIYNLAYQNDKDRLFAVYSPDNPGNTDYQYRRCEVWNGSKMEIEKFIAHDHQLGLRDVDLSKTGDLLGLCARDGTASVWAWEPGTQQYKLSVKSGSGHSNIVSSIRFSPRDDFLVTTSHDNQLVFWNLSSGEELARIKVDKQGSIPYAYLGALKECAFAPDGKTLAVTVASDIWWIDLDHYDEQIEALRKERLESMHTNFANVDEVQLALNEVAMNHRATRLMQSGNFAEAAPLLDQLRQSDPTDIVKWRDNAFSWLAAGNDQKYRRVCHEMIEHFRGAVDPDIASSIIAVCTRAPISMEDLSALEQFAEACARQYPEYQVFAKFRAGKVHEVADLLTRGEIIYSLSRGDSLVLAMAYQSMGDSQRARDLLRETLDFDSRISQDPPLWDAIYKIMFREAASQLGDESVEPVDLGLLPVDENGKSLNLDFETGTLENWTADGEAFMSQPIKGDTVSYRQTSLGSTHQGNYWVGTFENFGDPPIGKLTSVPFTITHPWASFLIAGGNGISVEIVLNDSEEVIFRVNDPNWATMHRIHLPIEPWIGEKIFVRVIDDRPDDRGPISFDNFRFHNARPGSPSPALVAPKSSVKMNWNIRYFAYDEHPLDDEAHWKQTISKAPLHTQQIDSLDFQWGDAAPATGGPADKFAVVATAKVKTAAKNYIFTAVSDDGLRVYFDDEKIIDHWTNHPAMVDIARVSSTGGEHTIRVEYFETDVDATLRLWMTPENAQVALPSAKLEEKAGSP